MLETFPPDTVDRRVYAQHFSYVSLNPALTMGPCWALHEPPIWVAVRGRAYALICRTRSYKGVASSEVLNSKHFRGFSTFPNQYH